MLLVELGDNNLELAAIAAAVDLVDFRHAAEYLGATARVIVARMKR